MSLLHHSSHLYAIALNPLIGASVIDTIEKVTIYLERIGRTLSDEHQDPSISFVTDAAAAALRYEASRINGSSTAEKSPAGVAGRCLEQAVESV